MAIVKGVFVHSIPEDANADILRILESSTENGSYTVTGSYEYIHGYRTVEHNAIDTLKWYKIEFYNSSDGTVSARSDAIYGGDYDKSKPFVALSTTFDGAGFATASELYSFSHLTEEDVSVSEVQRKLKMSRSFIDLVTETQDIDKFSRIYTADIARRKYNAYLNIVKRAEISYALALIYRDLADDIVMRNFRNDHPDLDGVSIGQTSISLSESNDIQLAEYLESKSQSYGQQAISIIQSLLPTSIPLFYGDGMVRERFVHPQDIYAYAGQTPATSEATLEQVSESLTGFGSSMNGTWLDLSDIPSETSSTLEDAVLTINGVEYPINQYIDSYGEEVTITAGNNGFSINFYGTTPQIRWNYTLANDGFNLVDSDIITVRYWK